MRGFAVGSIYLGEVAKYTFENTTYSDNILFKIIYMGPLRLFLNQEFWIFVFFGITGYLLEGKKEDHILRRIIQRYLRLVLPTFLVMSMYFFIGQLGAFKFFRSADTKLSLATTMSFGDFLHDGISESTTGTGAAMLTTTFVIAASFWYAIQQFLIVMLAKQVLKMESAMIYLGIIAVCLIGQWNYTEIKKDVVNGAWGLSYYGNIPQFMAFTPAFLIGGLFASLGNKDQFKIWHYLKKIPALIHFIILAVAGSFQAGPGQDYCLKSTIGNNSCILWKTVSLDYRIPQLIFIYMGMISLFFVSFTNKDVQKYLSKEWVRKVGDVALMFWLLSTGFVAWLQKDTAYLLKDKLGIPNWINFCIAFVLWTPPLYWSAKYLTDKLDKECIAISKEVAAAFTDKMVKNVMSLVFWLFIVWVIADKICN